MPARSRCLTEGACALARFVLVTVVLPRQPIYAASIKRWWCSFGRFRDTLGFRELLMLFRQRQYETEDRTAARIGLDPQPSVMRVDNRA